MRFSSFYRSRALFFGWLLCALLLSSTLLFSSYYHRVSASSAPLPKPVSAGSSLTIKQRHPVVNEQSSIKLTAIVNGQTVEDVNWQSGSPDIASVDAQTGVVSGIQQGFATITAVRGGEAVSVFVVVAKITKGKGANVPGDSKTDNSGSLYISNPTQNVILKADKALTSDLVLFAGRPKLAGLRDGESSDALFAGPTAIAINNGVQGGLFVTDTLNHSIRKVNFNHRVETVLGRGVPGVNSFDESGAISFAQISLRSPRGIAVEAGGNLYVADTDNHAIYYLDFARRQAVLVAGMPGEAGNSDGIGPQARFKRPAALALNPEGNILAVADEDNNRVRIVEITFKENGKLSTVVSTLGLAGGMRAAHISQTNLDQTADDFRFENLQSLSFDNVGNIYLVDRNGVQVVTRPFESQPEIISLAQPEISFNQAVSVIVRGREVFVLDAQEQSASNAVKVVTVGEPVIDEIIPSTISQQQSEDIIIRGKNFAPETIVTLGDQLIVDAQVVSATEIHIKPPRNITAGIRGVSVLTRGGMAQRVINVLAKPVTELLIGETTTIAGGVSYFGDGGLAVDASLIFPNKVTLDVNGNLYVSDIRAQRIRRIDAATGVVTTAAGGGSSLADDVIATIAQISPTCVTLDAAGNLYIGDLLTSTVRRIDALTHTIKTVAGGVAGDFSGDGGPAIKASLGDAPKDIAIDSRGNLFIAADQRVRRVDAQTGIISTVAGNGLPADVGGNLALNASLAGLTGITIDAEDNLFIAGGNRVRRVDSLTGIITTVAGNGQFSLDFKHRDGKPATSVSLFTNGDSDVVIDQAGNLFIAEFFFGQVLRVDRASGLISTVKIDPLPQSNSCADLKLSGGLSIDGINRLFIVEFIAGQVRQVDLNSGESRRVIGGNKINLFGEHNGDGEPAITSALGRPNQVITDHQGNIYLSDIANGYIRKIDAVTGNIITVAGNGINECQASVIKDGMLATEVQIKPFKIAVDRAGNLFFSDTRQVWRIDANGTVKLYAGAPHGVRIDNDPFGGDGGLATQAALAAVTSLAVSDNGDLFIAAINTVSGGRIRKVDASSGIITTVAGNSAATGGDGGPASQAGIFPYDIAFDRHGDLLVVNIGSDLQITIRRIDAAGKIIKTIAGNGSTDFSGEGGPARAAGLGFVQSVSVDNTGNIYLGAVSFLETEVTPGVIARGKPRVWRIDAQTGLIDIAIDSPLGIYDGDGTSKASLAGFRDDGRVDVEVDRLGNLLVLNHDDAPVAALRLLKLSENSLNNIVQITEAKYQKPVLQISGNGFGATGAKIDINGRDVTNLITVQTDIELTLTANRKSLNLKKGINQLTITSANGATDSFNLKF